MRFILLFLILLCTEAWAFRLQIIHSNDLHSHFEGSEGHGGYVSLKSTADAWRKEAQRRAMPTIHLDGGDFGEGSSFFFADKGATSLRMLDELGIDAVVIGNHDLLQGGREMAELIERANIQAKILSANIQDQFLNESRGTVAQFWIKDIEGVRVGVFGLTTAEPHYQYAIRNTGKVKNPLAEIKRIEKMADDLKVDVLIALTHIGSKADKKLAAKSRRIDFIVGGHSHERIEKAIKVKNKNGKEVAIVQAGSFSMALGRAFLDIDPKSKVSTFVDSELKMLPHSFHSDRVTLDHIDQAKIDRERYFGRSWGERIGSTDIELSGHKDGRTRKVATCWGQHLAEMVKQAAKADAGIHISGFTGDTIAPGPITFGNIIENFPHFRHFGDNGWHISTVRVPTKLLTAIRALVTRVPGGVGTNLAMPKEVGEAETLVLAFPSEIAYSLEQYFPQFKDQIIKRAQDTGLGYWATMESYIKTHSPLRCLE